MSGNRVGTSQGRRKIPMTRIANKSSRLVTFSKRRDGLFRKASELSTLCGADVAMIVFSPGGKVYSFGHSSVQSTINKYMGRGNYTDNVLPVMEVQERVRIHQLNQQLAERRSQLEAERCVAKELDEMKKVAAQTHELWGVPEGKLNREQRKQLQVMLEELLKDVEQQKTKVKEACEARKNVVAQTAFSGSDGGANAGGFGESIIPQGLTWGSGIGLRNSVAGIFSHGLGNALDNIGKSVSGGASVSDVESFITPHGLDVGHLNPSSSFVVRPTSSFDVGHLGPISSYGAGHVGPSSSLGIGFGVGHPTPSSSFGVRHIGPSWSHHVGHISRIESAPSLKDGARGVKNSMTPNGYVLWEGIGVSQLSSPSSFSVGHLSPSSLGVGHVGPLWSNDVENSSSAVDYTSNYGTSLLLQKYSQGNATHSMTPHGYAQGYSGVDASSTPPLFGNVGKDSFSFAEDEFGGFGMSMMFNYLNDVGATATDSTGFIGGDSIGVGAVGPSSLLGVGQVSLPPSSGWTDGAAHGQSMKPPSGNGQGFPFDYHR